MSINPLPSDPDKIFKRSSQRRNDSAELDVFEAAKYFSGYNEVSGNNNYREKHSYSTREERQRWRIGGGRISLDLPIRPSSNPIKNPVVEKERGAVSTKEKLGNVKHKQPSSPGGRIASFLNSLFHQAGSKNKSKSKSTPHDEEESPGGWRRRRRSSISHFLSSGKSTTTTTTTTTNSSSKSLYSSSSSGFRTPPPYANTPTKSYKEFLNYSAQKQMASVDDHKRDIDSLSWLDEKLKFIETLSERQRVWADDHRNPEEEKDKFGRKSNDHRERDHAVVHDDDDDGGESDSSSDLFELQNYDLSCGGLPVYETTNVESIKRSAPISNRNL